MEQGTLRIGFIGAGAVGSTLARAVESAGYPVAGVADRLLDRAISLARELPDCRAVADAQSVVEASDLVFLTVPDDLIESVCSSVSWNPETAAVHCSGALSLDVLAHAAKVGAPAGACHPMQTFAGAEDAAVLNGCMFGIEAAEPLRSILDDLVQRVGGWSITVRGEDKARYHLAGVLASNYLVTLASEAAAVFREMGLSREDALRGLLPLLRSTVENLGNHGLPAALTGPISRGDIDTVQRHLETLSGSDPATLDLYIELGKRTIPVALERGNLPVAAAHQLIELFEAYAER